MLRESWKAAERRTGGIFDVHVEEYLRETRQHHLPQARIIVESLRHLQQHNLQEAYLRGSFASGEADIHSDIDMFLVVSPENLPATFQSFCDHLNENYIVIVECHDKLVRDYGGIGFMFLCQERGGKPFQFDLYMAMKGVPPKTLLPSCPRIYSSDPAYCWLDESRPKIEIPSHTQNFIDRYTRNESKDQRAEHMFKDIMIALFIMSKHVQRKQNARALNDNNHAIGVCVDMILNALDQTTYHTSLYAADKLLQECRVGANPVLSGCAGNLEAAICRAPSQEQVRMIYGVAKGVVEEFHPDIIKENAFAIARFENLIETRPEAPKASLASQSRLAR